MTIIYLNDELIFFMFLIKMTNEFAQLIPTTEKITKPISDFQLSVGATPSRFDYLFS